MESSEGKREEGMSFGRAGFVRRFKEAEHVTRTLQGSLRVPCKVPSPRNEAFRASTRRKVKDS